MKVSRTPRTASLHQGCLYTRHGCRHDERSTQRSLRTCAAETDKVQAAETEPQPEQAEQPLVDAGAAASTSEPRDDDVLPESLMDSLNQAARASQVAFGKGCKRANVEILLPELWDAISGAVFAEKGDQQRWWKLCKRFADDMIEQTGAKNPKVLFPDIGVAAYLQNQWKDTNFEMASLRDREPVDGSEDLVIVASPDPTNAQDCVKLHKLVSEMTPMALFNARLVSGDVGIGLNVRRMRENFLGQFEITYSIWPIGDEGTIFKKFPGKWQVFLLDEKEPGRYRLVAEREERPAGDVLDRILMQAGKGQAEDADAGEQQGAGILQSVANTVTSMQRFAKSLSN